MKFHGFFPKKKLPRSWRKAFVILAALVLLAVIPGAYFALRNPSAAQAAWFDANWSYRQKIPVTAHTSLESNVYFTVTVDTSNTAKFQSNCGDIRITDSRTKNLKYFVVSGCTTASTVLHVLVPSFPAGAQDFFMYYGNPSASNGASAADFSTAATGVTVGSIATEEAGVNPVGYWKFNEGSDQTTQDSSSNKINGTLGANSSAAADDPTWATEDLCISGKCLKFDGTNDLVNVSDTSAARLGNTGSAEAWVKPNAYPGAATWSVIINKGNWGAGRNMYAIYYQQSTSALRFDIGGGAASNAISVANTLTPLNTWSHVAMTWDGTTVKAYINGQQVGTTAQTVTPDTSTYALQFGSANTARYFQGFIDEPMIFSYARTAAQIQVDYSSGAASIGSQQQGTLSNGLNGYWKMDETSWTVDCSTSSVLDSSGNSINGQACPNSTGPAGAAIGEFGNAGSFDGSNDYVNLGNISAFKVSTKTVSFWAKPGSITNTAPVFSGADANYYVGFAQNNMLLASYANAAGSQVTVYSPTNVYTSNVWQHFAFVFTVSGSNVVVEEFVNGVSVQRSTSTAGASGTYGTSYIIGGFASGTFLYTGSLDDLRFYNRALSSAEVRQLFNFAPGPIGEWRFEEGTGSSVTDSSGNGSTGTWNGTLGRQWTQGKYGKGGLFNGSDNYVGVSTSAFPNPTNAITLETWVNITTHKNWNNFIFRDGWFTNGKTAFDFYSDSSGIARFGISTSASTSFEAVTPALSTGTWYHLAGTYDGANLKIYLNGVLQSTTAASNLTFSSISTLTLSDAASNKLNGKLDDVKIYNYARTASQIQEDMRGTALSTGVLSNVAGAATNTKPASAVAYWKFDEGASTTANSVGSAGTVLNGTLTNMSSPATSTSGWTSSGKVNKALNFDGTNDYVTIPSSTNLSPGTGGFSVSAWIKTSASYAGGVGWIFSNYGSTTNNVFGVDISTANKLSCLARDGAGNIVQPSPGGAALNDGAWHHVTCTYNAGTLNMYVDGKQTATATNASVGTIDTTGLAKTIGTFATSVGTQNFTGQIDEVKVYGFALTQDQVYADFNQNLSQNFGVSETKEAANDLSDGAGNDPVAYWPLDEKYGTSAIDKNGNANTGTLTNNPSWTQGKVNAGVDFNGSSGFINAQSGSTLDDLGPVTYSFWIYPRSSGEGNLGRIFEKTNTILFIDGGTSVSLEVAHATTNLKRTAASLLTLNTWQFITVTWDGTTSASGIKMYKNGTEVGSYTLTQNAVGARTSDAAANFYIGNRAGDDRTLDGKIDEIKVYNYVRSRSQISYDFNRGSALAWWKMDECQGTTVRDSSGTGYDGTLTIGGSGTQTQAGTCNTSGTAWGNGAAGKYNSSLNFDATDDYVQLSAINLTYPFTFSAWVKPATINNTIDVNSRVIGSRNAVASDIFYGVALGNGSSGCGSGTNRLLLWSGGTCWIALSGNNALTSGVWQHIVITVDANLNATGYIDGKVQSSASVNAATWNVATMAIGSTYAGFGSLFDGQMDDIRLFNYALSQNQVNKLYNENVSVLYGPATGAP